VNKSINLHEQFAFFFKDKGVQPFVYLLSKKMEEGHICLDLNNESLSEELMGTIYENSVLDRSILLDSGQYVCQKLEEKLPLLIHDSKLYLHRYFYYETAIIEDLKKMLLISATEKASRILFLQSKIDFISKLASNTDVSSYQEDEKPDWQLIGALQAFVNNFTIITGGPGTGKTTTVAKVLALLLQSNPDIKIALAAPTGKAAVRMKESLLGNKESENWGIKNLINSLKPSTIHRLLGSIKDSPQFKKNKVNPLDYDVVIVDEASMIGTTLFAKLLDAINPQKTRLIILGDANQLASVDVGSLFGDICLTQQHILNCFSAESKTFLNSFLKQQHQLSAESFVLKGIQNSLSEHIVELKKTYRYNTLSKMGRFTKALIEGKENKVSEIILNDDESLVFNPEYSTTVFNSIVKEYKQYILEEDTYLALQKINDIRVICAVKQSKEGVYHTNERIEKVLKKYFDDFAIESGTINTQFKPSSDFYHNQPIIVTKNHPDLGLFNGDIGIIRRSKDDNKLKAYFIDEDKEGNLKAVSPGFIGDCETVFAMTIHKSQGSEFKQVLVILPKKSDMQLLTRELIYTAVTRAKVKATIQSTEIVLLAATNRKVQRASGITERILIEHELCQ
jgi:exodeoxyribonuclease V alpha subunit